MNEQGMSSMGAEPVSHIEDGDFKAVAGRLNENLAAAALRLVDATQDFTSLIQSFVTAGEALERSLSIHRELGAASQKALEDSREAARNAALSASESQQARDSSKDYLDRTTVEYGTVAELVENLQQRIAALSVLAAPMPHIVKEGPSVIELSQSMGSAGEMDYSTLPADQAPDEDIDLEAAS